MSPFLSGGTTTACLGEVLFFLCFLLNRQPNTCNMRVSKKHSQAQYLGRLHEIWVTEKSYCPRKDCFALTLVQVGHAVFSGLFVGLRGARGTASVCFVVRVRCTDSVCLPCAPLLEDTVLSM